VAGLPKGVFLTNHVRWPDSEVKKAELLLVIAVDGLLRCPAERKEAATREALVKLRPYLQEALEALETIGRVRGLTDEELVQREAFMMLLDLAGQPDHR
jgi:hypothetical protein